MNNKIMDELNSLNLPIPEIVKTLERENQTEMLDYLSQLNENARKAYIIAFTHLGTSFNIYKSNGYKEWKKKQT